MIPRVDQVISTLLTYASCNDGVSFSCDREISHTEVISYATTSAPNHPLHKDEAQTVQQLCSSIEGLEHDTRWSEGQGRLSRAVGPTVAEFMIQFWEDEWVV